MADKNCYKLEIRQLPIGKHIFEYKLKDDFFEFSKEIEEISGNVDAEINIDKKNSNIELTLSLKGEIYVLCDRCLDKMPLDIDNKSIMVLKMDNNGGLINNEELELDYKDGIINLKPLFYEEIMLNIPIKKVHKDGECNQKMLKLYNDYVVSDKKNIEKKQIDPRWESLKHIK